MYKNKLFLIILLICFCFGTNAQNENKPKYKIGINTGINYPKLRGHELAKYHNFKVGYLLGFTFDYYLKKRLSIKLGVNYERKIKKIKLTYFNHNAIETNTERFNEIYEYLNLPILIKYEFGHSNFFTNGGPFINYLFNSKFESDYPFDNGDYITAQKKIDFGVSIGLGANFSLNKKNDLTIEVRDDFGIIDTGSVPKQIEGSAKTNTIKLILGWNLGI